MAIGTHSSVPSEALSFWAYLLASARKAFSFVQDHIAETGYGLAGFRG